MLTVVIGGPWHVGVSLSDEALKLLGWTHDKRIVALDLKLRSDSELIRVCKELGPRASTRNCELTLVDVADDDTPFITLYNNYENEVLKIKPHIQTGTSAAPQTQKTVLDVLACTHLSDAEKIAAITIILK